MSSVMVLVIRCLAAKARLSNSGWAQFPPPPK